MFSQLNAWIEFIKKYWNFLFHPPSYFTHFDLLPCIHFVLNFHLSFYHIDLLLLIVCLEFCQRSVCLLLLLLLALWHSSIKRWSSVLTVCAAPGTYKWLNQIYVSIMDSVYNQYSVWHFDIQPFLFIHITKI